MRRAGALTGVPFPGLLGLFLFLLLLAACGRGAAPVVTVYVPDEQVDALADWFASSPFDVALVAGDSARQVDLLQSRQDAPPADVIVTGSVIDIWRAGDRGALRPLQAGAVASLPPALRDPEGAWAALQVRPAQVVAAEGFDTTAIRTYADLASPALAGQLCLSSAALPANRVLAAMLIDELGLKPAERVLRGWVRNLALPPFTTQAELVGAVATGACRLAIVHGDAARAGTRVVAVEPLYADVVAVGVSRHAPRAEAAQALVAWMLANRDDVAPPGSLSKSNVGIAGWRDMEARRLAERAAYR